MKAIIALVSAFLLLASVGCSSKQARLEEARKELGQLMQQLADLGAESAQDAAKVMPALADAASDPTNPKNLAGLKDATEASAKLMKKQGAAMAKVQELEGKIKVKQKEIEDLEKSLGLNK